MVIRRVFLYTVACRLSLVAAAALAFGPLPVMGQGTGAGGAEKRAARKDYITKLRRAEALIGAQDLAGAESELAAILRRNARDGEALNLLGIVRVRQQRADEAESLFKQSIAAAPRMAGARINLGLLYAVKSQLEEAAVQLEEALKIAPGNGDAAAHLVTVLRGLAAQAISSDSEKALAHLMRAKALAPADPDVLFEFAMTALRLSLHEDAAKALTAALRKRPDEPKFLYALARARLMAGEAVEAAKLFTRYVEARPQDAAGHYGLGYTLALLKRGPEAARAFKRSLELRPEQTESPYQLGLLAYADGDVDAAAAWFEKVLTRYGGHAGALLGMGLVHFSRKQYELAQKSLERAIALEPALAKAHYHLGLTHARLGNKEAASQELELAAKLEREQKDKERVILRLLESEPDARPPQER
ncbi:MAG TPA: tetratricopeptide repeat protein [Blastocatellia bacterium]|nr:tetratricopeptide repeat protein [Blastocatellia bacterium]